MTYKPNQKSLTERPKEIIIKKEQENLDSILGKITPNCEEF